MEKFDKEKLKKLIHTIAYATGDLHDFGRTKLYKVMWFFEANQYAINHRPFSGAVYVRDTHGPRLKHYESILNEMESEGLIQQFDEKYYDATIKRIKSQKAPEGGLLTHEQTRDLNYWIDKISKMKASEISEESHDYGWEIVKQGQEIPYLAVLAKRIREPNEDELVWGLKRAKELGYEKSLWVCGGLLRKSGFEIPSIKPSKNG